MTTTQQTMGSALVVDPMVVDPCNDPGWAELALAQGSVFHSAAWLRVLRDGYRLRPRAVMTDGGGFAWVEVDDVRGRRLVSLPFTDFAGAIGLMGPEGPAAALSAPLPGDPLVAVRVLVADRFGHGADLDRYRTGLGLEEVDRLAWHWADLVPDGSGDDPLWSDLASGARQNVRRSRRSGVRLEVRSDLDALAEYRRLHVGLRKTKYRLLAQPWSFFAALHRHFAPDRLRVVLAYVEDRPELGSVAGVVLLRHGDWGYYKLNASTEHGWSVRANDAVMWEAMVQARRWGCRWFDFGVSDLDQPGLIRYKNKYATGRGEVVVLRRGGGVKSWSARQVDRALPVLTRVLTAPRCPDAVGAQASRVLYRMFC